MDPSIATAVWVMFATLLLLLSLYDAVVSLFGLSRPTEPAPAKRQRRFAIFIAAHDEEVVIAQCIESLLEQEYPRDRFQIFVVADRCSDATAVVAAHAGATVLERNVNRGPDGKSAALRYVLDRVVSLGLEFDAICVFDADNLVSPNFLETMNRHLEAGECCIQGYLDVKNPEDSWVTGSIALAYWTTNRLWQAARYRLGVSCALGGTGFCIDWHLARQLAWRTTCLTDDLDLQMALVQRGLRVTWAHAARTYDEKPISLVASWRQRVRWMNGHWTVTHLHLLPLVWRALRRRDLTAMDAALYLLQPLRTVLAATAMGAIALMSFFGAEMPPVWISIPLLGSCLAYWAHFCFFGFPLLGLLLERVPARYWRFYPHALLFGLTWVPIAFWGMMTCGRSSWNSTRHTRALRFDAQFLSGGGRLALPESRLQCQEAAAVSRSSPPIAVSFDNNQSPMSGL